MFFRKPAEAALSQQTCGASLGWGRGAGTLWKALAKTSPLIQLTSRLRTQGQQQVRGAPQTSFGRTTCCFTSLCPVLPTAGTCTAASPDRRVSITANSSGALTWQSCPLESPRGLCWALQGPLQGSNYPPECSGPYPRTLLPSRGPPILTKLKV